MSRPLFFASVGVALALAGAAAQAQDLTNTGTQLTVEPGVLLSVPGALRNQAGATLTPGGTVQVGGDFINTGTVVPANGTLVLIGSTEQTLSAGGASLGRVEVRNTGPAGQNRILLPTDLTVLQQLTLVSGLPRTDATATLHLPDGATLTGETAGRYVQGNLEITRAAVQGSTVVDFGNGLVLNPNGGSLGAVRVLRTAGLQQAGVSFGQNPANPSQHTIDRIWSVTADQTPTAPATLTLSWLPDDDNGLTNFAQAQVWRMPASSAPWEAIGSPTDASARSITVSTTAFSRLTVSEGQKPLPVQLVSFTARRVGPDALLRWTTAQELNNAGFEVESSPDGRTFRSVGRVAGHGTTTQRHDYQLTDPNLARYQVPLVYYRLRQLDQDGTATTSQVQTVAVPSEALPLAVQVYPTPFTTQATVLIQAPETSPATLRVVDAVGRTLWQQTLPLTKGENRLNLPQAHTWPVGTYVLGVRQGHQFRTVKVVRE
ncbi:T9SS type A sorting domain-containing protein [Hymenobacter sp. DG01]|uniref:T9SS type A sorting domain-containing protein n=1 Tax=Hymenobacter sp. DG01 TaxID=2584940 RepID=UPI001124C15D|nr:T9SS type A sorting domain-containing protein [Hymenobacter sp. DG01]